MSDTYILDRCGCKCSSKDPPGLQCKECGTELTMQDLTYISTPEGLRTACVKVLQSDIARRSVFYDILADFVGKTITAPPETSKQLPTITPPETPTITPETLVTPANDTDLPSLPEDAFLADSTFTVSPAGDVMRCLIAQRIVPDMYKLISTAQTVKSHKTRCGGCTMSGHNKTNALCPIKIISERTPYMYSQFLATLKQKTKPKPSKNIPASQTFYTPQTLNTPATPQNTPQKLPKKAKAIAVAFPPLAIKSIKSSNSDNGTGYGGAKHEATLKSVSDSQQRSDTTNTEVLQKVVSVLETVTDTYPAVDFIVLKEYLPVIIQLLRNDSIFDIHLRKDLYTVLLRFLRVLSGTQGLCGMVLTKYNGHCIHSEYTMLNQQADTFMKLHSTASSSDAEIDNDVLEILGIAFDISDTYTSIRQVYEMYGPSTSNDDVTGQCEKTYMPRMRELSFMEADLDLSQHTYYSVFSTDTGMTKTKLIAVSKELASMSTSLPLSDDSAVIVRVSSSRMDVMSFMVTGPMDTPYAYGCFIFDLYLPRGYPTGPPMCKLRTTGGGAVRFNPNLYACGKVCLSLLGTWSGPGWVPNVSSILQVIISIQSLIMVSEPYYNEPGYERLRGTISGIRSSKEYNRKIQKYTTRYAILDHLSALSASGGGTGGRTSVFDDAMRLYYVNNRKGLLKVVSGWGCGDDYTKIKKCLSLIK